MEKQEVKTGMIVSFGRAHGERTIGKVVKVNREKVKVQQLEGRGVLRTYPVGTLWSVPARLLAPAEVSQATAAMTVPVAPVERFIESEEPAAVEIPKAEPVKVEPKAEAKTPRKPSRKIANSPHKTGRRPRQHRPTISDPITGFKFHGSPGESLLDFGHRLERLLAKHPS